MIKVNKVSINEDSTGSLDSLKSEIKRLKSEIILLKSGAISPMTEAMISSPNNLAGTGSQNTKMIGVLQQYVEEELDKQTQMEL